MKGSPYREILVFITFAVSLFFVMDNMRTPPSPREGIHLAADTPAPTTVESWMEVTLSHPARSLTVRVGAGELLTEQDVLRTDIEFQLPTTGETLTLEVEWSDLEGRPYVEVSLEPEERQPIRFGSWGRTGTQVFRWRIFPEEQP